MGTLVIHDVACPWGQNWWTPFYDLAAYHKIYLMVSDEFINKNTNYRLDLMEFKKWVISELDGEVIVREEGRGTGFTYHYAYILLDEDYVKFKLSKWYDIFHRADF